VSHQSINPPSPQSKTFVPPDTLLLIRLFLPLDLGRSSIKLSELNKDLSLLECAGRLGGVVREGGEGVGF
jgi:hypothetical protein